MFVEFFDLLVRDEKQELFKRCFNRCYAAVSVSYEYEKAKASHLWNFDERYHEHGIEVLYERFSYAMAMVVDRFHKDCSEIYGLRDAQKKSLAFAVGLSGCVDKVFKRSIRDLDLEDAALEYYQEDYFDKAYDEFWDSHKRLKAEVAAVRNGFRPEEWTFVHGFSDREGMKVGDFDAANRDCLHVMRIHKQSGNVDVEKFLTATKREYLPLMVELFMAKPKGDVFADKPPI